MFPTNLNKKSQLLGIVWMITHCFLISLVVVMAKFLGQEGFSPTQIVFFHSFVAFIILLPFAILKEGRGLIKTDKFLLHLARGILGVLSLFLYFFALKIMPLTDGRAIALFSPVLTFIFAIIFVKEKLNSKKLLALFLSLVGGYIIINPGSSTSLHMASLMILAAMLMWSVIDLIIKSLSKTESSVKQLFFLTGFLSLFSLPFAIFSWKAPSGIMDISLLGAIGFLFLVNSMAVFLAYKNADLTTLMPFDFSGMVFTAIISFFIFNEVIKLNTLIGSIIVFSSSLYLIYHESKAGKEFTKISESNIERE